MSKLDDIKRRLAAIITNPPGWDACNATDAIDAQQYAGGWRAPGWGCDSLDHLMDGLNAILADWPAERERVDALTAEERNAVAEAHKRLVHLRPLEVFLLAIIDRLAPRPEEAP